MAGLGFCCSVGESSAWKPPPCQCAGWALGGILKAGEANGARLHGVSVMQQLGLTRVNLAMYGDGPYGLYTLTFAWLESTLGGSYSLPG